MDADDFFNFRVGEAIADLSGAPLGGSRYPVEARLDGRTFVKFHVDIGIGDVIVEPVETIAARDWLAFAEIAPPLIPMITREQHFAEKIHAYSIPRSTPNSRVRDLVDLYLLVESSTLDSAHCLDALRRTFDRRGTHELPRDLAPPPRDWDRPFHGIAEECGIAVECSAAFELLQCFWSNLGKYAPRSSRTNVIES